MEQKRARETAAKPPSPDSTEALRAVLRDVVPERIFQATTGTWFEFPAGQRVVWAHEIAIELAKLGYVIVRRGLTCSSEEFEVLVKVARGEERRACAAELELARLKAADEYAQLAAVDALDGIFVEVQSKHLDELAARLARGER